MKKDPSVPIDRTVTIPSGHSIRYVEQGQGPAVVFIHGSGPGAFGYTNFKQNMPALAVAGFRAIAPDLPGYGRSSKPEGVDYDLDLFSSSMFELLDELGLNEIALVGNSLGGAIAMDMAVRQPERVSKLVLMAPGGIEQRDVMRAMPGIARMHEEFLGRGFREPAELGALMEMLVFDPTHITADLVAERFSVVQTQPKDVLRRMNIVPASEQKLAKLTLPVLGFWGLNDQFCPVSGAQKVLSACPDCRFVIFARCGHWVMVEYADEFNAQVLAFLLRKS